MIHLRRRARFPRSNVTLANFPPPRPSGPAPTLLPSSPETRYFFRRRKCALRRRPRWRRRRLMLEATELMSLGGPGGMLPGALRRCNMLPAALPRKEVPVCSASLMVIWC